MLNGCVAAGFSGGWVKNQEKRLIPHGNWIRVVDYMVMWCRVVRKRVLGRGKVFGAGLWRPWAWVAATLGNGRGACGANT